MSRVKQFWLVWNPEGRAPTYQHDSEESARSEAERLAKLNPGQSFYVLETVGCVKKIEVQWAQCVPPEYLETAMPF